MVGKKSFGVLDDVKEREKKLETISESSMLHSITDFKTEEQHEKKDKDLEDWESKLNDLESKLENETEMIRDDYLHYVWNCIDWHKKNIELPKGIEAECKEMWYDENKFKVISHDEYIFNCVDGRVIVSGKRYINKNPIGDYWIKVNVDEKIVLNADFKIRYNDDGCEVQFSSKDVNFIDPKQLSDTTIADDIYSYFLTVSYDAKEEQEKLIRNKYKKLSKKIKL